jgi:hypothetical protein
MKIASSAKSVWTGCLVRVKSEAWNSLRTQVWQQTLLGLSFHLPLSLDALRTKPWKRI